MKQSRRFFFVSLSALVAAAVFGAGSAHAADKTLVLGTDTSFMPFEFRQGSSYTGFDLDLWAQIAKDLHLKYRLQPMDFTGLIPGLQTGNIDVAIAGISIKPERQKVIDFSAPYYLSGIAAIVRTNNTNVHSINDLNGKTIAAKTGTTTIDWIKGHLKSAQISQFPNVDEAYMALMAGRTDAAMHDTPNVQYYANTVGKGKVRVVGTIPSGDAYGIAFPKGSPLVAKVNADLARIKADGRYAQLYRKWFGSEPPKF